MKRWLCLAILAAFIDRLPADDEFEREPINYSKTAPVNAVSKLQERLNREEATLEFDPHFGYLKALLKELGVPSSSQTLVFSKTSLQRNRITSRTPRSLYFNDETYIGFCQQGDVLEISAVDPQLGAVFYTLDQEPAEQPQFVRQTDNCLICHGSSQTRGVPGHLLRSVFADASGSPILSAGTYRIDQTSPFEQRWGGWYVTGQHGAQRHLGNLVIRDQKVQEPVDNSAGHNIVDLSSRLRIDDLLTPHSDLVALLVLEHQAMAHNLLTHAAFTVRQALHYEQALNRELKEPADHRWPSTTSRIKSAGEPLVKYLLFSGEARLTEPVRGSCDFASEFAAHGPRDAQGRSLREFDLQTRVFRYPCSYLITSPSFLAMHDEMKSYIWTRFAEILSGRDPSPEFAHLSRADRQAVWEILRETHPQLPAGWVDRAKPDQLSNSR